MTSKRFNFLLSLLCFSFYLTRTQITAHEAVLQMQKGINIGNTFDAPGGETAWGNPLIQEYYFDDYKSAGFTAIRIPVTWDQHTGTSSPYAIDSAFISRVEQVIDWGLSRGLFIIVNAHHEAWLKGDYSSTNVDRFNAIWTQISTRFKDKSEKLLFEILNEPEKMTQDHLNQLNVRILGIIRRTNPTRLVVYAGTGYSSNNDLKNAHVPSTSDKYLIANFHCYDPWSWVSSKDPSATWGTQADRDGIKNIFDGVADFVASQGIPVMVNEWGAPSIHEYNSRLTFYKTYSDNVISHGMGGFAWDDGGDFRTYDRQLPADHRTNGKWVGDVKDVMTADIFSAKGMKASFWSQMSGVQREDTSDVDGGKDVGWIDTNDWMIYLINVPTSGQYKIEYRVATPNSNAVVRVEKSGGGQTYGHLNLANTGGWQNWSTISQVISLNEGLQYIGIVGEVGGFNLNWIRLSPVTSFLSN